MDISQLSAAITIQNINLQVGTAVMKMGKDLAEQNGTDMIQMMKQMELSINPHIGNNIDVIL